MGLSTKKGTLITSPGHLPGLEGNFLVEANQHRGKFADALANFGQRMSNPDAILMDRPILSPEEWLNDPYYSGPLKEEFWVQKREDFIKCAQKDVLEVIATGAIGWGKSAILKALCAYDIYVLSCFKSPQTALGIGQSEWLLGVLVSLNMTKANDKLFSPLKEMIDRTLYFQRDFPYNKNRTSVLEWPQKLIRVRSGVTSEKSVHSEDIFFLGISEANFLPVVKDSKLKRNGDELDVAADLLINCERRMVSRFGPDRPLTRIVLDSSKQYPDDIVERRMKRLRAGEEKHKFAILEHSQWVAKRDVLVPTTGKPIFTVDPDNTPLSERKMFAVEIGSETRLSRILDIEDVPNLPADTQILWVPPECKLDFEKDVEGALRDLGGISVLGIKPFIGNRSAVLDCMREEKNGFTAAESVHPFVGARGDQAWHTTLRDQVRLQEHLLCDGKGKPLIDPDVPRTVHIDVGLTGDCLGFAMGHVTDMAKVRRSMHDGVTQCFQCRGEAKMFCQRCNGRGVRTVGGVRVRCAGCLGARLFNCPACSGTGLHGVEVTRPITYIDLMLSVTPPKDAAIQIDDVEALISQLRAMGYYIPIITADGHQSAQFLQRQINHYGAMSAEILSVDRTKDPYYAHRDAITDITTCGRRRLSTYPYPPYLREITRVEEKPQKIDHPPSGQKDVADAVTGVIMNCETYSQLHHATTDVGMSVITF